MSDTEDLLKKPYSASPARVDAILNTAAHADFSALRDYMRYLTDEVGVPSAAISIRCAHKEIFSFSTGFKDRESGEPITRDALYHMYSCSKVVTCVAALQLLERGHILLTDPVSDYLPEFADVRVGPDMHVPPRPMNLGDLFNMSSGLDYNLLTPAIEEAVISTGRRSPTREIVRAIAKSPLLYDPGQGWSYGLSHDVLACVVEVVSGMRFSEYVKKNIFLPLGMVDSCYHIEEVDTSRMAAQYRYNETSKRVQRVGITNNYVPGPDYDAGGAGMISTLDDMAVFADALACDGIGQNGERILSPSTVSMMRENQLDAHRLDMYHERFPRFLGYGYGLGVRTHIDRTVGSVSPLGEFGWAGAAGAFLVSDTENAFSVFYAQHMLTSLERIIHPRLRNIIYSILAL